MKNNLKIIDMPGQALTAFKKLSVLFKKTNKGVLVYCTQRAF
jgi:hypothetical protein